MSLRIKIFFSFLFYFLLCISNAFAINKISVFGTIENMDGQLLSDALITLKNQNKSAVTNRFGEFDLGKVFPFASKIEFSITMSDEFTTFIILPNSSSLNGSK